VIRLTSPFASLIEEARRENLWRLAQPKGAAAPPNTAPPRARRGFGPGRAVVDVTLETRLVSNPPSPSRTGRVRLLPISFALHGVFLVAIVLVPLIGPEALPLPATGGRVFFVSPVASAPPPPPPPPPAAAPVATALPSPTRPLPRSTPAFVAPIESPQQVKPEEGIGLGVPGGQPGGVAEGGVPGGVAGGVVGGVVGGVSEAPRREPVRVGSVVKEPRKLRHVDAAYPRSAVQARVEGLVVLECTIDVAGHVADVKVLRGVPVLDEAAVVAVKQWAYAPTLLDGVPVPVIMTVTVSFNLKQGRTR
jgi:periplasmic protein TonB